MPLVSPSQGGMAEPSLLQVQASAGGLMATPTPEHTPGTPRPGRGVAASLDFPRPL